MNKSFEEPSEIPVYLFTGFLESGKTRFIQKSLANPRFNDGSPILLLICEEGLEEFDQTLFAAPNVTIVNLDSYESLTPHALSQLLAKYSSESVMIEYNGMWIRENLEDLLPDDWVIVQEFMFADSTTFLNYNNNMRSLVVDKMKYCDQIVFNRFEGNIDDMTIFHRIVRSVSRESVIAYEDPSGHITIDNLEIPLPYDLSLPIVEINDESFADWFTDLNENTDKYRGKKFRIKGRIMTNTAPDSTDSFHFGRDLMVCCPADISFANIKAYWTECDTLQNNAWYLMTGEIEIAQGSSNQREPVFRVISMQAAQKPKNEIATFY